MNDLVRDLRSTIVCLQETKLSHVEGPDIRETVGAEFERHFAYLPAQETRGGVLVAVHEDFYTVQSSFITSNAVTVKVQATTSGASWWLTVVYGPQDDSAKLAFLNELRQISCITSDLWLIIGDFNMILQASDKSNDNINRRLMGAFHKTVDDLELKELQLKGRKFTWTNNVTHTRIDRAFCTSDWEMMMPSCSLQAISSLVSVTEPPS